MIQIIQIDGKRLNVDIYVPFDEVTVPERVCQARAVSIWVFAQR